VIRNGLQVTKYNKGYLKNIPAKAGIYGTYLNGFPLLRECLIE